MSLPDLEANTRNLIDGRIVESGGPELAVVIENEGFEAWQ